MKQQIDTTDLPMIYVDYIGGPIMKYHYPQDDPISETIMLTNTHIDLEELATAIEEGWIRTQVHPDLPLTILNYTQKTQFKQNWTPLTLAARGLVIDVTGKIIARPLPKFFNYSEHDPEEIPTDESYVTYEKMDGSLGILFWYKGEWIWATRGSFTSDQALEAPKIFEENGHSYDVLDIESTHLFELVYPENTIVVKYEDRRTVSLGSINNETGEETEPNTLFPTPEVFNLSIEEMRQMERPNFEGFVLRYESGFRVKIKLEDYVRLHRIVFGLSTKSVWEHLSSGQDFDSLIAEVPEEFHPWARETALRLLRDYHKLMGEAIGDYLSWTVDDDRKATALNYHEYGKEPMAARFALLDGKDPSTAIWNHIKPDFEAAK